MIKKGETGALTILNGWIPPGIHQEHGGRLGQIQGDTTGFQADQEHRNVYVVHY
jgi:hypothetical protein